MTSEIKRRRKPPPRRHIELGTTSLPQLGDRRDCPLKGLGVHSDPIADPSKVRQIERYRPQPRHGPRLGTPEHPESVHDVPLPHENRGKGRDPKHREEGLVGGHERRYPPLPFQSLVAEPPQW